MAEFAEKGAWPVGGGVLDQSAAFVEALAVLRSEEAVWKAKAG